MTILTRYLKFEIAKEARMPDENAMARIKGVRMKKANALFGRNVALVSICLCLLAVGAVNPLVRELFEDSEADGSSSSSIIFDLLSPEHSGPCLTSF